MDRVIMRRVTWTLLVLLALVASGLGVRPVQATLTIYDVLDAVNALRAANGLTALEANSSLMTSAQAHSEYQAFLGHWTHEGSGGSTPKSRAIAAGYGGGATVFISENVAEISPTAGLDFLIYTIWADAVHWNTMVNPNYTHAGVGVAEANGEVFYTLDVGYISGAAAVQNTPSGGGNTGTVKATVPLIQPVLAATPRDDGSIVHIVEYGQTLSSIAGIYGVTVDQIKALNGLTLNTIWVDMELIIRVAFTPSMTPTITNTPVPPTLTPTLTSTPRPPTQTVTSTITVTPTPEKILSGFSFNADTRRGIAIGIIIACAGGLLIMVVSGLRKKK
jgi:LysM repeat protein